MNMGLKIRISSYSDLLNYLKSEPVRICWYGPRASDVSGFEKLVNITGIISCYSSSDTLKTIPTLTNEKHGFRPKISIDDLAAKFIESGELLEFVNKYNIKAILPYDSNLDLENFCKEHGIIYYSSPDKLKDDLRDKTRIDEISRSIGLETIPGIPGVIDDFDYEDLVSKFKLPLFLHFAEGAGGSGNRIINSVKEFEKVKKEKSGKRLNVKKFFIGKSCCVDLCVTPNAVICGLLEEMIIGSPPINSNPTEYVGSSWFENKYSYEFRVKIHNICTRLGNYLRNKGFIGVFHPDFLFGEKGEIFLTELNMRFGGSCGVINRFEMKTGKIPYMLQNIFSFDDKDVEINDVALSEKSLLPVDYGLLILKNNFGKPIKINKRYKSGIYRIISNKIQSTGLTDFEKLNSEELVYISGLPDSEKGTVVGENAFICEVITQKQISNSQSKLNQYGADLANIVIGSIILQ
jgi:hypothetical protein